MKRLFCLLLAVLISCSMYNDCVAAENDISSENTWTLGDLGHPRSSFALGSARHLEGKNVVVSLFANSPDSKWDDDEKERMLKQLKTACEYIEDTASSYGKHVEMIYDWSEEDKADLIESGYVFWRISSTPMNKQEAHLDAKISTWLNNYVDYEALLKEYDADNIFLIVYLDTGGRPYAITYDGIDNPSESLIMYSGQNPAAVAHEILHLYGAHDFYEGAEYTDDAVRYLTEKYPNDIMLRTDGGSEIPNEVGELTAYHLGWVDRIEDVSKYRQLSRYEIK